MGLPCPTPIKELLDSRLALLASRAGSRLPEPEALSRLLAASDFAFDLLVADPTLWPDLLAQRLPPEPTPDADESQFLTDLRRFRRSRSLELIHRDLAGIDAVPATLLGSSRLAERSLGLALARAESELQPRFGLPVCAAGQPLGLIVMALGKLGGGELNFCSDLDLVFAFREGGRTRGPRELDAEAWFVRLGQRLIALLSQVTGDGLAYHVDMRLRPFGQSGRLALSLDAMEVYFQREGRDWERYAWIKARPVAGDLPGGADLLRRLRPFIYRRYLDYTAFEAFRDMKARIEAEVDRKGLSDNIKLGAGGIREIEFVAQLHQLIRGGREPLLRTQSLYGALEASRQLGLLPEHQIQALLAAYDFLRRLENRLQMFADRQTHELPADPLERARLAWTLDFPDWSLLEARLTEHRDRVREVFDAVFTGPARRSVSVSEGVWTSLWQGLREGEDLDTRLAGAGFRQPERLAEGLRGLLASPLLKSHSARSAQRFDRLMPALLECAVRQKDPDATLARLLALVVAIGRRSTYLSLLDEHPAILSRLAALLDRSPWVAERLAQQPVLLDDLIDPRLQAGDDAAGAESVEETLSRALAEADRRCAAQPDADPEALLEILRQSQQSVAFRLALGRLDGRLAPVPVARALAQLADALIQRVLRLAEAIQVHSCGRLGDAQGSGFAVLGYGSLGGLELGFGSDLDLVFIYDESLSGLESSGPRRLEAHAWFVRLAQKLVHLLTVAGAAGSLYEVDTRLRPNGNQGWLVTSMAAFASYQARDAWVWEHQALVRSRCLAGDPSLVARFQALRAEVLARPRESAHTATEVTAMRARWREELDRSGAEGFDLKQGDGGLVDLEFLLQQQVLLASCHHPQLLEATDTPGLLAALVRAELFSAAEADGLVAAHTLLLDRALACTLAGSARVAALDAPLTAAREDIRRAVAAHA